MVRRTEAELCGIRCVVLESAPDRPGPVAAASLAVSLEGSLADTALLAPLVAACWAEWVGEQARSQGVDATVHPFGTADVVGVTAEVPRADRLRLRELPEWLLPGWFHLSVPPLDPERLERLRGRSLVRLSEQERNIDEVRRRVFAPGHRYSLGYADRVRALRHADVDAVQAAAYELACGQPVLATPAAPDVSRATPLDVPDPAPPEMDGPLTDGVSHAFHTVDDTGAEQVVYVAGTPGVALGSPWRFPLHVAWAVLGAREGPLDRRLRRDRALTSSFAAFSREAAEGGYGVCWAECRPDAVSAVAEQVHAAFAELAAGEGLDPSMLRSAREQLVARHHAAIRAERDRVEWLCSYELAGIDPGELIAYPARIAAVTRGDVSWAASLFLRA